MGRAMVQSGSAGYSEGQGGSQADGQIDTVRSSLSIGLINHLSAGHMYSGQGL